MPYNRPWKSFEQQLEILKARGLAVSDEDAAISYLQRLGYYRLSGYWYPFRQLEVTQDSATGALAAQRQDNFVAHAHFEDAVKLYIFDKLLRQLVLDAVERIEVAIRVDIAHTLGERDMFAHHNPDELHPNFTRKNKQGRFPHKEWLEKYQHLVNRSHEEFVSHYKRNHGARLPIWVAVELWDFGATSKFYAGMKVKDKAEIAAKYGVSDWRVMQSWLRSINYLRNIAAHHSRLWNRNIVDQPKLPKQGEIALFDPFIGKADLIARPFLLFCILRYLLQTVCPNTRWGERLRDQLMDFPALHLDRFGQQDMGCVAGWETWTVWPKNGGQ